MFLIGLLCSEDPLVQTTRMQKKVLILMNDLIINDDGILSDNPYLVRTVFGINKELIEKLLSMFGESVDFTNVQMIQHREYALKILFRMHQYMPKTLGPQVVPAM